MSKITQSFLFLSFASLTPLSYAGNVMECPGLEPFKATYHSEIHKWITLKGDGVQELLHVGENIWEFKFEVDSMVADMRETVRFEWDSEGCQVIPISHMNEIKGKLIKDRKSYFDHNDEGVIVGEYRGKPFTLAPRDLYLDPLGLQIQARQDLKAGKTEMKYHMIHKGKILIDHYRKIGSEPVQINGQIYDAVKLEKVRPDSSDRETYLWMAPDFNYTLVKLLHKEPDGEWYSVLIKNHIFK